MGFPAPWRRVSPFACLYLDKLNGSELFIINSNLQVSFLIRCHHLWIDHVDSPRVSFLRVSKAILTLLAWLVGLLTSAWWVVAKNVAFCTIHHVLKEIPIWFAVNCTGLTTTGHYILNICNALKQTSVESKMSLTFQRRDLRVVLRDLKVGH